MTELGQMRFEESGHSPRYRRAGDKPDEAPWFSAGTSATARAAYTVIHLLIVAGIIVCAVADEEILARPAHASPAAVTVILLGPALFLIGAALFKRVVYQRKLPPLYAGCNCAIL